MRLPGVLGSASLIIAAVPIICAAGAVTGNPLETTWFRCSGFGPAFNASSCAACHGDGNASTVYVSLEVIDPTGGHVVAQFSRSRSGAIEQRPLPHHASLRRTPAVVGLGPIELVERAAIEELADPDDEDGDGVSGRLPSGRFGWKARFPDLTLAVAAAFANEFGLSSPWFGERDDPTPAHPDLTREEVEAVAEYVRSLPPPRSRGVVGDSGAALFDQVGCAACHRPSLTLPGDRPPIAPYTDLLLHDMGRALADGMPEGNATGEEFRTPPLWGLADHAGPYLHDGRATTLDDAVRMHGGEAGRSLQKYLSLTAADRRHLLAFLNRL